MIEAIDEDAEEGQEVKIAPARKEHLVYLLFQGDVYYPRSGLENLVGVFQSKEEAQSAMEPEKEFRWARIYSMNIEEPFESKLLSERWC